MDLEEFSCALCLYFTSENEKDFFTTTECGHIFHNNCLKTSFDGGYKDCPICRVQIDLSKLRKIYGLQTFNPKPKEEYSGDSSNVLKINSEDFSNLEDVKHYDHKFKIILVGNAAVGKSSLMQRYADGVYNTRLFSTVGCDWRSKTVNIGGKLINLSIWDTVGQEKHRSLVTNYVRETHGALVVYDICDSSSLENVEDWISFVSDYGFPECVKILVGNKSDLEDQRVVTKKHAKKLAEKLEVPFFETSAKDSYNVEAVFRTIAARILENEPLLKKIEAKRLCPNIRLDSRPREQEMNSSCSLTWNWIRNGTSNCWKGFKNALPR